MTFEEYLEEALGDTSGKHAHKEFVELARKLGYKFKRTIKHRGIVNTEVETKSRIMSHTLEKGVHHIYSATQSGNQQGRAQNKNLELAIKEARANEKKRLMG